MTDTAIFSFTRAADDVVDIRTTQIDGEPWFAAIDVARALSLTTSSGVGVHLRKLEPTEKRKVELPTPNRIGGKGEAYIISESGLYKLVMRSDKAEAVVFQNWVTQEVLPSIRKTASMPWPTTAGTPCRCPWT